MLIHLPSHLICAVRELGTLGHIVNRCRVWSLIPGVLRHAPAQTLNRPG